MQLGNQALELECRIQPGIPLLELDYIIQTGIRSLELFEYRIQPGNPALELEYIIQPGNPVLESIESTPSERQTSGSHFATSNTIKLVHAQSIRSLLTFYRVQGFFKLHAHTIVRRNLCHLSAT